jgi:CheY-like chemotaxis protein
MPDPMSRALGAAADQPIDRHVAWIGGAPGLELAWARHATGRLAHVSELDRPPAPWSPPLWSAVPPSPDAPLERAANATLPARVLAPDGRPTAPVWPTLAVLATEAPGRWRLDDCIVLARCWPLAVIIAVTTSLGDGRRRSGPVLPGIEEVPWNELPARLAIWLADLTAGLPGALGVPPTARREERLLQTSEGLARARGRRATRVAVAAPDPLALEGLVGLVAGLGHEVTARAVGRTPVDAPTDVVVWEVADVDQATLVWLRLLAGARPARQVVVVTAFPRGDSALAALQAGARAVLGQPICLEALAGALLEASRSLRIGLGSTQQSR